jgi:hypothetical protein
MEGFMPDDEKATLEVADNGEQNSDSKSGDDETTGLFNNERNALYADYYGEEDGGDSDDSDQKPADEKSEDGDHDTDSDDDDKVDTDGDASDDKGDGPGPEEDKDQKMVPLAALHEERKKRQDLSSEVKVLSERVTQLLEDNNKLLDRVAPRDSGDDDYQSPDEDELDAHDRQVQKELKELKEFKKRQEEEGQTKKAKEIKAQFEEAVVKVSKELSEEGLHGFDTFGIHMVAQKLREKMAELGKDEAIKEYDHPEGWKKLYKEEIWPDVSKKFSVGLVKEEENKGKKIENKKKAKLPNRPKGPAPASEGKKDEDLTQEEMFADYMTRRKAQLFD